MKITRIVKSFGTGSLHVILPKKYFREGQELIFEVEDQTVANVSDLKRISRIEEEIEKLKLELQDVRKEAEISEIPQDSLTKEMRFEILKLIERKWGDLFKKCGKLVESHNLT